ncbi:MAG: sodium:alanine symporter family protein [Proteobacteria bacterium]|nr:sodium:alanine symporter family protein [Pseudomonadota bacterium]
MADLEQILTFFDGLLQSAWYFPYLLLGTGIFFTIYLKAPQIFYFRHAWRVLRGTYDKPGATGDASHFQALTTAISGTVGTGNIGGVAFAIFLGGPAALFWMWMTAFFGMTTKFVEVTLSHKYRDVDDEGYIVGGPMFVMEKGLNLKWLGVIFAIATVVSSFGSGNMPQSNNIAVGLQGTFGIPEWMTGGVLALLLAVVILGGVKRIIKVAEKIVPTMAILYFVTGLAVVFANIENVWPSLVNVVSDAFTGSAAVGGFLGATFAYAFNKGVGRGLYSNEAGQGSAPIAHAAARTDQPVSEGMVSILEPFIDTIIICTLTGLVILSSGVWLEKHENQFQQFDTNVVTGVWTDTAEQDRAALFDYLNGRDSKIESFNGTIEVVEGVLQPGHYTLLHNRSVAEGVLIGSVDRRFTGTLTVNRGNIENDVVLTGKSLIHSAALTSEAFTRSAFGDYGRYVVALVLLLFAFSTAVAWSYYGDRAVVYLVGTAWLTPYRLTYVLGFFFAAIADTSLIWLIAAITVAFMTIPNLIAILLLRKEMKQAIADYWQDFESGR